jgi:hypothetical protein
MLANAPQVFLRASEMVDNCTIKDVGHQGLKPLVPAHVPSVQRVWGLSKKQSPLFME